MKNVTISLDDETARWARIEAAKNDKSVSRFVAELLRRHMGEDDVYSRARRSFESRPARKLSRKGSRYPTRDEVHTR